MFGKPKTNFHAMKAHILQVPQYLAWLRRRARLGMVYCLSCDTSGLLLLVQKRFVCV